jgi:prostatic aicd phosphatase
MNVQFIHDANYSKSLPPAILQQARDLANWHEYNVFSSLDLGGIGNVAGRTIIPSIINAISQISNSSQPVKLFAEAISYKPFLSLFNMTDAVKANPELAGIVNYAAAVALEVRQPSSGGEPILRFNFQNGTDSEFKTYNILNASGDVPVSTFVNYLAPVAINTTSEWCNVCQNTESRGCDAIALATSQGHQQGLSRLHRDQIGAGFLGAGVALIVAVVTLIVLVRMGMLSIGNKKRKQSRESFLKN